MGRILRRVFILILSCVTLNLSGCDLDDNKKTTSSAETVDAKTSDIKTTALVEDKVVNQKPDHKNEGYKNHTYKKPGAAVSFANTQPLFVEFPGEVDVVLTLQASNSSGEMVAKVSVDQGVNLVSTQTEFQFSLIKGGQYSLPLRLSIDNVGRYYVNVHVTILSEGRADTRALAAILQVGKEANKVEKLNLPDSDNDGERVISLPAQESVGEK